MRTRINNFTMAYENEGSGMPLLLIHGYPLNRQLWADQIRALKDIAHLIVPDLRGHGESESTPAPYTIDILADDCHELLNILGIEQPIIVGGLSMGGYIAMAFYRRYPERVNGMVLAATRASADTSEGRANRDKAIQLARKEGPAAIAESMLPKMFAPKTYITRPELVNEIRKMMIGTSTEGIIGALTAMKERPDSFDILSQFNKPALIIHGDEDQIMSIEDAQAIQKAIRGSKLEIIPSAGHLPNLEQPQAFNAALRRFLQNLR